MIAVEVQPLAGGGVALHMAGHAGAPTNLEGHDLVCAAASILCCTMAEVIPAHCPRPGTEMACGRAHLKGVPERGREAAFLAAWEGLLLGFKLLEKQYPRCLEVTGWR